MNSPNYNLICRLDLFAIGKEKLKIRPKAKTKWKDERKGAKYFLYSKLEI